MKLFLRSSLEHLDRLERRGREEIQATRNFIQILHDCNLDDSTEDGCDTTVDSQEEFNDLNAIFNNVIPTLLVKLRDRLFMLQPLPPVASLEAMGLLSEGASTPFGQPSEGPSTDGTSSSAIYGPEAQPQLASDKEVSTESINDGYAVIEAPRVCNLSIDNLCVPSKENLVVEPGVLAPRIRPRRDGFPRQVFDAKDISCLSSPTAHLNDVCINSCAALLYSQFKLPTVDCAILSTYDLTRIRSNLPDEIIWRNTSWTSYWEKNVWILPIQRPSGIGHWVACIIYFQTKEIHLFDSLAGSWECDINDIMKLVVRLLTIARQRHSGVQIDLDGWTPLELNAKPCQSNTYDCGLWVLAAITAVLRGRHVTNLHEERMSDWRNYLCSMVLSLPART